MDQRSSIRQGILLSAKSLGIDPIVLATAISYETKGTFNPIIKGPTTQYGQHEGLIQAGEPQARHLGIDWKHAVRTQLGPNGAVVKYLREAGVKPGMGLHEVYSAINAGHVGLGNRSDAKNGGAPGTVDEKVAGMGDHRENAIRFMGGVSSGKNSFATDVVANRDANKSIANRGPFPSAPFQPKNAAVVPHNANTDRDAPSRDTNKMNPNTLIQRMMAAGGRQSNNVEDMRPQSRDEEDPGPQSLDEDPAYQDAIKMFTEQSGRAPQTTSDWLEIRRLYEADGMEPTDKNSTAVKVINKMGMDDGDGSDSEGAGDQDIPQPAGPQASTGGPNISDMMTSNQQNAVESDPAFPMALQQWIQMHRGQEPATDSDWMEVQQMMQAVKTPPVTGPVMPPSGIPQRGGPSGDVQQMILQKMLGGGNR